MQVTSLLSREEPVHHHHGEGETCTSCGVEHSHTQVQLKQTLVGVVFVLNSFIVDWAFPSGHAVAAASGFVGALILGIPILRTAIKDLRLGLLSINELVAIAVLAAFASGDYKTAGVVAFCWPYRNEYDARFLARRLRDRGAVTALPVVVAPRTPLVFREWHPGVRLARGVYEIPYPAEGPAVRPENVLVPMNAFDEAGFRLGYGGGFFDRTLAALVDRPRVIGVAYELARIPTIHPQPWDIPMDFVVTERGVYVRRDGRLHGR